MKCDENTVYTVNSEVTEHGRKRTYLRGFDK
jgi:hypothetical protein